MSNARACGIIIKYLQFAEFFLLLKDKAMDNILSSLNPEQLRPVCDTEGHVLVLAGAGSGKTRVLTSRIAYILESGLCAPSGILAITFTNKAAGEMRERLEGMLGDVSSMWICTIHAMCVRILRQFAESAGLKSNFSIYSETERANVIKKAFKELDFDDEKLLKDAKYHIANAKMLGLEPDIYGSRYADVPHMDEIVLIYDRYEKHLSSNNALDFDDLLIRTLRLLRGNEEARDYLSGRFKYILVDEFQDTNAVQYNIIKLLASKHCNLFAVGDDDQSIYGWRGAEIENILRFDKDFPDAKVYKLERNYRSTGSILKFANEIIKHNGTRRGKTLWTEIADGETPVFYPAEEEAEEALFAARTITAAVARGEKYSSFAVLLKSSSLSAPIFSSSSFFLCSASASCSGSSESGKDLSWFRRTSLLSSIPLRLIRSAASSSALLPVFDEYSSRAKEVATSFLAPSSVIMVRKSSLLVISFRMAFSNAI